MSNWWFWLGLLLRVREARRRLDYNLAGFPDRACDQEIWFSNMDAWMLLSRGMGWL